MKDSDCSGTKVYFRLQLRVSKYLQQTVGRKGLKPEDLARTVSLKVTLQHYKCHCCKTPFITPSIHPIPVWRSRIPALT